MFEENRYAAEGSTIKVKNTPFFSQRCFLRREQSVILHYVWANMITISEVPDLKQCDILETLPRHTSKSMLPAREISYVALTDAALLR